MKTYEIEEDKFIFLVNKLAQLEILIGVDAMFLNMSEEERTAEVFSKVKEIANTEFYRNLRVVK